MVKYTIQKMGPEGHDEQVVTRQALVQEVRQTLEGQATTQGGSGYSALGAWQVAVGATIGKARGGKVVQPTYVVPSVDLAAVEAAVSELEAVLVEHEKELREQGKLAASEEVSLNMLLLPQIAGG